MAKTVDPITIQNKSSPGSDPERKARSLMRKTGKSIPRVTRPNMGWWRYTAPAHDSERFDMINWNELLTYGSEHAINKFL
jgi:hypothetical protein